MMIRKRLIDDIGLLDEAFFLYFEEVDFFYRAANAGWQTWYVPTSKVMHIEGASTGIKLTKRRPKYWYNSRRRYFIKHHGVLGLVYTDLLWLLGRLSFLIRRFLKLGAQKMHNDPKWLMLDLLGGDFLAIFTGRAWRLEKEKIK
jgi:GT2 family glycosyltransferase